MKHRASRHTLTLLFLSLMYSAAGLAETIRIPLGQQGQINHTALPKTGQTKQAVEQRFGPPQKIVAAVGKPPIGRWEYEGFTVYFEYDHVIHSVATHHPKHSDNAE